MLPETTIAGRVCGEPVNQPTQKGSFTKVNIEVEMGREKTAVYQVTFFKGAQAAMNLRPGMAVFVPVVVSAREYNGKWYVDLQSPNGIVYAEMAAGGTGLPMPQQRQAAPATSRPPATRPATAGLNVSLDDAGEVIPF